MPDSRLTGAICGALGAKTSERARMGRFGPSATLFKRYVAVVALALRTPSKLDRSALPPPLEPSPCSAGVRGAGYVSLAIAVAIACEPRAIARMGIVLLCWKKN